MPECSFPEFDLRSPKPINVDVTWTHSISFKENKQNATSHANCRGVPSTLGQGASEPVWVLWWHKTQHT